MNEHDRMSPDEERAARLVRGLETPEADPRFRTQLREAFVSGRIVEEAPSPRTVRVATPWWRLPVVGWAAAATAVVAVLVSVLVLNQPPAWKVIGVEGNGIAIVDGRRVPIDRTDALDAAIRSGARVQVPDGALISLASTGQMAVDLVGGSDLVVPRLPGRWFGRASYAEVERGSMRITTGTAFHGARLRVQTPEAGVEVTGTTLAVICEPAGTCVCVLEGRVMVGPRDGPMAEVQAGRRRFLFVDGTEEADEMRPTERMKLSMLRDARSGMMGDGKAPAPPGR